MTVAEIPKTQRSKIDRIMLVAVVREKVVKRFGFKKVYHQIVEDLKKLESGIKITLPVQRLVKAGLLLHPADNLEAHSVGGFSQSFSSGDICRFCHIKYEDLQENVHSYGSKQHSRWTKEEYDRAADIVEANQKDQCESNDSMDEDSIIDHVAESGSDNSEEDEDVSEEDDAIGTEDLFGVKHRCPLNALKAFHSTSGFPPDILHDVFEGVVSEDLLGIIRILKAEKWFSIPQYNAALKAISYKSYESSDKPESVPESVKVRKLVGKAVSNWTHLRNFPLIVRNFVRRNDEPALVLALQLHEVVERITASEFRDFEIVVLEEKIIEYLDARVELRNMYPDILGHAKPKTHNLTHYPEAIANFGPPVTYWTARYESRHRIAKSTAESAKNFKNISLTLSTRQQQRQSSVFYHGMFDTVELVVSDKIMYKNDMRGTTDLEKFILPFMSEKDFICQRVTFRSQVYSSGDIVVLEAFNPDEVKVGLVSTMLVKGDSVLFLIREYVARRHLLRYFKGSSNDPALTVFDAKNLCDYKPLVNQGTPSQVIFCLHHHVSTGFD